MEKVMQSRKYTMVINNPLEAGFDHDTIIEKLHKCAPRYFCLADEIATTGTPHTHIFLYARSPIRFPTVKHRFPTAHIEKSYGSARDNREYILKGGKWADTDKAETIVPGSFYEWGEVPAEKEEQSPEKYQLIQGIRDGMSDSEIIEEFPNMVFHIRDFSVIRQTFLAEKYAVENRPLEVSYIYGASGTGKTRSIYQKHDPKSICRITNYRAAKGISFDNYTGQDVLVFEEFNSQIPLEDMLNYLDIYPLTLPARYNDRTACYTKVYITSNLPLEKQYRMEQIDRPETWQAFLRRIHNVTQYMADGSVWEIVQGGKSYDKK